MSRFMSQLGCRRLARCNTLASVFPIILTILMLNARVSRVQAIITPDLSVSESNTNNNNVNDMNDITANNDDSVSASTMYGIKRSWQSLQGSWGKRATIDGWSPDPMDNDDDSYATDHIIPILISNGNDRSDPTLKYSLMYLTSAAMLDKLTNTQPQIKEISAFKMIDNTDNNDDRDDILNDKRTWKNMNVAWGKRRNAPAWNKFRGAWGKREPGWNNLKGMWGKRMNKDWQKLHGGWGKRSVPLTQMN